LLTNCHTLILRRLLGHGPEPPPSEHDLYVYNVAPDSLPLSKEFSAGQTHRFAPPKGALDRFPKLVWVKCHLVVDNFCHYASIAKPAEKLDPSQKAGYTYRRGADFIPLLQDFAEEMRSPIGAREAHYLAHILVEIAVDYAIYRADRSVPLTLREAQRGMEPAQRREYAEGLAALYGCEPAKVERSQGAPARFYGNLHDIDALFLDGRTKILLRKLDLPYSEENIGRARRLILEAAARAEDFMEFVDSAVAVLSDREAWAGEGALASGTD